MGRQRWLVTARQSSGSGRSTSALNLDDTIRETADMASSEQTVVRPRIAELYSMEVWREGLREDVVPISKNEITIGRGSRSVTVDLPLKGDP